MLDPVPADSLSGALRPRRMWLRALAAGTLTAGVSAASAQGIEPRTYSNAPVGVNFVVAGYAATRGGLAFDPSLPVKNPDLETSSALLAYARVLDLGGMSAKFDAIVPYTWLTGTADFRGGQIERIVDGPADPLFRLSVNLYGAPALTLKEFRAYQQDLIVGASVQVSVPLGQYDPNRIVNIGMNRWSFKPEVGVSKAVGPWTLELTGSAAFYTDNTNFYGGQTRSQDPIYSIQGHAIYNFRSGVWVSLDANYFAGGRTEIDGKRNTDLQQNWRVGTTLAIPIDLYNSIKFYASSGVSARTGNEFDALGFAWQYRWGGGL